MKSLDTNILLYAVNADCPEQKACEALIRQAMREPNTWIIADQVWFELYRLLRNPAVLAKPLTAQEAAETIKWYRNKTGWQHCAWETGMMPKLDRFWSAQAFPAKRCFDMILAITLKSNGVTEFYTRNIKDFLEYNFFTVTDPIG